MEGVPFTAPGPGCVTSIPTSIVGFSFSQLKLAASRVWLEYNQNHGIGHINNGLLDASKPHVHFESNVWMALTRAD
jgi:hypothetical protein